ncbi:ATP-binding cassette domain-containing protein [Pontibacillus yanchengensis]|uniref:ATP-binding cassette domain-containing protein n=2 Tax=Pontibacillus yanchengensis TaxID=462910 RepID=A0ACC7VL04_9BACI|nr:methionine ABC transporter ATP-binding protein [Pontibacillus yanchengensis]MYL33717.1 ATP-binding cassette domain-containing protein [Pontibacillus yanchengensis]MYL55385.1 ATP-binding cassette domain-containing protein [Pontibacillus yanchengensis]
MISIKELQKVFQSSSGNVQAVDDVSLDIEKGEIFGVIGYSGAGKSTFIRLLNRLEDPTSGEVIIDGNDISKLRGKGLRHARQEIGMIYQHFNLLWSRTVKENIGFPLEIANVSKQDREQRVNELVDLVGLSGRENAYPSQLSGGQKQRVGIARALANKPKVLLCDEATSALDPETTDSILDLLTDINKKLGLTIILITHEMHVIRKISNRVAVMEEGRVVEQGDVLDVFRNPQQKVTKRFVEQVMGDRDQDDSLQEILTQYDSGHIVKLHFVGEKTNQAVISEVAKQYDISINILQGKITQTQKGAYGTLVVHLTGEEQVIQEAIQYISETSVKVEVNPNAS